MIKNNRFLPLFLESSSLECSTNPNPEVPLIDEAGSDVTVQHINFFKRWSFKPLSENTYHQAVLAWGNKPSAAKAMRFAQRHHLPLVRLEDGFLRSFDTGADSRYACSMVIDDVGIYFDSLHPSRLEVLINQNLTLNTQQQQIAGHALSCILTQKLSKYNPVFTTPVEEVTVKASMYTSHILIVDQVAGDQSIRGAGADKYSFEKMLTTAMKMYPESAVWIKPHPAGKGYLSQIINSHLDKQSYQRIFMIESQVNSIELLEAMSTVFTVSSHMGFEALLLGKTVYCFGASWYSGWGVTNDSYVPWAMQQSLQRRGQATVLSLFYAAYIEYSRYVDPSTAKITDIQGAIDWLVRNRDIQRRYAGQTVGLQFSYWKRSFLKQYFQLPAMSLRLTQHIKSPLVSAFDSIPMSNETITKLVGELPQQWLVWGLANKQDLTNKMLSLSLQKDSNGTIWCMEDGFVRSQGLGANLIAPLSLVIDKTGIYYDAKQSNDFETLANQLFLTPLQRQRIQNIRQCLVDNQVSKYNLHPQHTLKRPSGNKYLILVVGQVEDDASIKHCGSVIKTNLALLEQVRAANPHAYILYKPHPDVEADLRPGSIASDKVLKLADKLVIEAGITDCLEICDAVHTISSLTGFEALIRNKSVTCYGLPFYAGWGLTTDIVATQRRQRRLDIETLLYVSLIAYPLYHLPHGYGFASIEVVLAYINEQKNRQLPEFNNVTQTNEGQDNQHSMKQSLLSINSRIAPRKAATYQRIKHRVIKTLIKLK